MEVIGNEAFSDDFSVVPNLGLSVGFARIYAKWFHHVLSDKSNIISK